MNFQEADRYYAELKQQHDAGAISDEEFEARLKELMVEDDENRWWGKAPGTGEWHYHDGNAWVPGTPPGYQRVSSEGPQKPTFQSTQAKSRTGLWVGLGIVALLVIVLVAALAIVGSLSSDGSQAASEQNDKEKSDNKKESDSEEESKTSEQKAASDDSGATSQEELRVAVEEYYEAVDRQDWNYTYNNLDSQTKRRYTSAEYIQKNQYLASVDPLAQSSTEIVSEVSTSSPVEVELTQTFRSGLTKSRITYFVWEDDAWKHRFSQQDDEIFLPDASYDEFVRAKQSGSS